jgi:methanogenic corrinoid protein MtbC1
MKELLSPKQVALAIGVSEASLKRWCDKGLVPMIRTAGGHRRLPVNGVLQFLRAQGHRIVRPEVLGLPKASAMRPSAADASAWELRDALEVGDEERARQIVLGQYLSGATVADLCDRVVTKAFHDMGQRWQHGDVEVYQERRGGQITMRILFELRKMLPTPAVDAPVAIGGTLEHDPYSLATAMVELALRECGWQAESYGAGNPASTLCAAIRDVKPKLFWLSVSTADCVSEFLADYTELYNTAIENGTVMIVGGRALDESLRREMAYTAFCDSLAHIVNFAQTVHAVDPEPRD